jgi:hypothetical protein
MKGIPHHRNLPRVYVEYQAGIFRIRNSLIQRVPKKGTKKGMHTLALVNLGF